MKIEANYYLNGQSYEFHIQDGLFVNIQPIPLNRELPIISPGFTDIQINGYKGVDFNTKFDLDSASLMLEELVRNGVFSIYPTIITNSVENIKRLGNQIVNWTEKSKLAKAMIKGIHLEGPYISPNDGARGAHNIKFVKAPNVEEFEGIQRELNDFIKIVTISPEWDESLAFIKSVSNKVLVAIGHTTASTERINEAAKSGAKLSTHLGNGAEAVLPRHPNYIWSQLANDDLYASIIADGFHLDEDVMKVMYRVKKEKLILVSDAVNLAGLPPGHYEQAVGGKVTLSDDGRLYLTDNPKYLAGSAKDLLSCAQYYYQHVNKNIYEVIRSMTSNVNNLMSIVNPIDKGKKADFILVANNSLEIKSAYFSAREWL